MFAFGNVNAVEVFRAAATNVKFTAAFGHWHGKQIQGGVEGEKRKVAW
jgi:hypothetical protein